MSQIRAFLAVDLDDDLKPKVNRVMKEFKQIDTRINYVDLLNLHFTNGCYKKKHMPIPYQLVKTTHTTTTLNNTEQ